MSATLRDRTFAKMTPTEWKDCLAPKVQGTWNLHEALDGQGSSLDFFVVFGSLAGTCGSSGQANYAAANSFLESFVRYRRQRGLPCSALNLGPVEETGMVSRDEKLLQMFRATSCHLLSEQEVLDGLHLAISQSSSPVGASDGSAGGVVTIGLSTTNPNPAAESSVRTAGWTGDIRFAIYSNLASTTERQPQITDDKFRAFVQRIEANPSLLNEPQTEIVVRRELGRLMTSYLGDGAEMSDEEVAGIAIDSMMAIEVKDWVRGNMNMDIGMDQTSRARNVGELAAVTVERLREKYGVHSMNAVLV
ncbi:ketoreductase domain-containing protein [Aspergillus lucknowensis]|uniref:KR-domain-containing protein n=1 Tax=Aspergillus lucknowensis TaxID=176173 RepID=A0ABR4LZU8_9EURO